MQDHKQCNQLAVSSVCSISVIYNVKKSMYTPDVIRWFPFCLCRTFYISMHFLCCILCRIQGVVYPSGHAVWSRWAPPIERSKLATFNPAGNVNCVVSIYTFCHKTNNLGSVGARKQRQIPVLSFSTLMTPQVQLNCTNEKNSPVEDLRLIRIL